MNRDMQDAIRGHIEGLLSLEQTGFFDEYGANFASCFEYDFGNGFGILVGVYPGGTYGEEYGVELCRIDEDGEYIPYGVFEDWVWFSKFGDVDFCMDTIIEAYNQCTKY